MKPIKLIIADDHQMLLDGIKALIEDFDGIEIIAEANDGLQLIDKVSEFSPDVVLTDINMPQCNGIEATEKIKAKHAKINILAMTMHNDLAHIEKMMQAGATGYILKNTGREELIEAIETVHSGESYYSNEVANTVLNSMKNPAAHKSVGSNIKNVPPEDLLTKRELEILKLIAEEHTSAAIAKQLFLSINTIETHRKNILRKLEVKSTVGLVRYAISHNLV